MRRIKQKYGPKQCDFCKEKGVKESALWMSSGLSLRQYACEEHKGKIIDHHDDGYISEGDYQSWGRL